MSRAKKVVWGRAALWVFLSGLLLTYVAVASNVLPGGLWALCLLVTMLGSIALSIVSLKKGERRGFAVTTLVLSLGLPLAVFVGFFIFFELFYVG